MQKRGQVTLFVAIGVLLIIIILILFFLMRVQVESASNINENIDISQTKLEAENIVKTCLNDVSKNAVWNMMEHGGYALQTNVNYYCSVYPEIWQSILVDIIEREDLDDYTYYHLPADILISGTADSYYLPAELPTENDNGRSIKCLEDYIKRKTIDCINNFVPLKTKGWEISSDNEEDVFVDVSLGEQVSIEVDVPREFTRDNSKFQIEKFSNLVSINFPLLFQQIKIARDACLNGNIANVKNVMDTNLPDGYNVHYFVRKKYNGNIILGGIQEGHQFIIKKGDYRFKFGVAC